MSKKKKGDKKDVGNRRQTNKNKIVLSFYGSILLTLILHYIAIGKLAINSTVQMAISFLIFNIIFGIINIFLKVDFGGTN